MGKVSGSSWWHSIGFGARRPHAPESDYADMGTAFGLDASMDDRAPPVAEPSDAVSSPEWRPEARDSRTSRRP
jgi:hypothetical protein